MTAPDNFKANEALQINNFGDATEALTKFIPKNSKNKRYTLDRMNKLMEFLGNPQNNLKIIHVAGTSGKTSTCYYIASLLKNSGLKVGLTVSPHVDQINERVQINHIPLPETKFCHLLEDFLSLVRASKIKPTYFEVLIAFAYWIFDRLKIDYAVIEVGLGGLLDGTNVIDRKDKICVITDIGLDHTSILGSTIDKIAYQKAGIIQNGNAVLIHKQPEAVMRVVNSVAKSHNAKIVVAEEDINSLHPPMNLPEFQKRNFSLALATCCFLVKRDQLKPPNQSLINKSATIVIPARMEIMHYKEKTLVLDGSHNQQKLNALVRAVKNSFAGSNIHLLVSFGHNKAPHIKESLNELKKVSSTITITTFNLGQDELRTPISPRGLEKLSKKCGFKDIIALNNPIEAFNYAVNSSQDVVLVTGSFYLLNHIRPLILSKK